MYKTENSAPDRVVRLVCARVAAMVEYDGRAGLGPV